jgi:hypothetical protein
VNSDQSFKDDWRMKGRPMDKNDLTIIKELKAQAEKLAATMHEVQMRGYNIKMGWDQGKLEVFEVHQLVPVHLEQQ